MASLGLLLWVHAIPITIKIDQKVRRHHDFLTVWDPTPSSTFNPGFLLTIKHVLSLGRLARICLMATHIAHGSNDKICGHMDGAPCSSERQRTANHFHLQRSRERIYSERRGRHSATGSPMDEGRLAHSELVYARRFFLTLPYSLRRFPVRLRSKLSNYDLASPGPDGKAVDNRSYSQAVSVKKGSIIAGTIQIENDPKTGPTYICSLDVDGVTQNETKLPIPVAKIPEFVYAICAVESYNTTRIKPVKKGDPSYDPKDYPADPIVLSSVDLQIQQEITPFQLIGR